MAGPETAHSRTARTVAEQGMCKAVVLDNRAEQVNEQALSGQAQPEQPEALPGLAQTGQALLEGTGGATWN